MSLRYEPFLKRGKLTQEQQDKFLALMVRKD